MACSNTLTIKRKTSSAFVLGVFFFYISFMYNKNGLIILIIGIEHSTLLLFLETGMSCFLDTLLKKLCVFQIQLSCSWMLQIKHLQLSTFLTKITTPPHIYNNNKLITTKIQFHSNNFYVVLIFTQDWICTLMKKLRPSAVAPLLVS